MNDNTPVTRADVTAELSALEERLVERIAKVETHLLTEMKEYIDERTHDAETRLLRAFSDYNNSAGVSQSRNNHQL